MRHTLNPQIINAVVWAAVMLSSAILLRGNGVTDKAFQILIFIYIAGWIRAAGPSARSRET